MPQLQLGYIITPRTPTHQPHILRNHHHISCATTWVSIKTANYKDVGNKQAYCELDKT